ncbi:MAG TPA: pyroglutamyl-peptidase I [Blastocatellia bacterium]|nr:pyroglutamyl-peptidase I [Blastocatellia bacterium]
MKKLLLTAFEPFAGEIINPSLEAARRMEGVEFPGAVVRVAELPVDRHRAVTVALELIATERPDVVVMLGEAGGRFRVSPERVAINVDDFRIPDNTGNQPRGEPIVEGGPVGYFSTLPIRAIAERIAKARIPVAVSNSAGTFLCNRLFYSVMHAINVKGWPTQAGFIHLPYLHEQTIEKRQDVASLSRESLEEAVRLAIEVSLTASATHDTVAAHHD